MTLARSAIAGRRFRLVGDYFGGGGTVVVNRTARVESLEDFEADLARIAAGGSGLAVLPAEICRAGDVGYPGAGYPAVEVEPEGAPDEPTILDLPSDQRPRERLRDSGATTLSDAELLAILLRTGVVGENAVTMGMRVIAEFDGLGGLSRAEYGELRRQRGVSDAKACQVMAALELGRRIAALPPANRPQISCPRDVANLIAPELSRLDQEHLLVLLLNTRNHVLLKRTIYVGTVNSSAVRPAEVLRPAVRENAPAIIIAHNHPSGDPTPSPEDAAVTRDMVAAGKLLNIEVLDHLVIGDGGNFVSMKEQGLGFDGA